LQLIALGNRCERTHLSLQRLQADHRNAALLATLTEAHIERLQSSRSAPALARRQR
jgi:hypothetical protein